MSSQPYEISPELADLLEHFKDRAENSADLNDLEATCVRQSLTAIGFRAECITRNLKQAIESLAKGRTYGTALSLQIALEAVASLEGRLRDAEFIMDREYAQRLKDAAKAEDEA